MDYIIECLEKFKKLPKEVQDRVGGVDVVQKVIKIEQEYNIKLGFLIILVFVGELEIDDIDEYLQKKYKLTNDKSRTLFNDLMNEVIDPILAKTINEDKSIDIDSKKEYINLSRTLNEGVIDTLNLNKSDLHLLNKKTIYILANNEDYKFQLLKSFLSNKEIITNKKFIIGNKAEKPSIENWVKDFIKKNGSGIFSNIVLTNYFSESKNIKVLIEQEKGLVNKIFSIYRNLAFFPESMNNIPVGEWEIFPTAKVLADTFSNKIISTPKTEEEKKIDELKKEENKYQVDSLERMAIDEEINNEKKIEGLKILSRKYPEGSLERRAIFEEINKLENKF